MIMPNPQGIGMRLQAISVGGDCESGGRKDMFAAMPRITQSGTDQVERLETLDRRRHLYRYTLERTTLPVCDYTGEFRIERVGEATSRIVWSARFGLTPDGDGRTIESIRRFLHAGTESLKSRYGTP
jgi:Polyketide cyclase / dehydrase and lipid transport